MRVLQVTSRYVPYAGGVESHVRAIATRLAERGHEVTVRTGDRRLFGADDDPPSPRSRRDGVAVRRHRSLAPGDAFHVAPGVAAAVRRTDADVVHAHNYHSLPLSAAALGCPRDVPLVLTPHYHGVSADALRDRLLAAYRPLGRWALGRADRVLAVSGWERARLRSDFGVDAAVVPNGLDVDRFANAAPEPADAPYLLCVGRLEAYKGVQHAIHALTELPEYDLLIAGSGPVRAELEQASRAAGVADRVRFLGYVADDRLPGLYAGAAAHLQLSSVEAYGMTVGESLAAGTPCVVRDARALSDWADREDCVGVDDVTPETVAAAVREAVGRGATTAPVPSWEDVVDDVLGVYDSVR